MTVIYTAVVAIAPRHQHGLQRGAPPDMLSGGGREILASYTAFGYKGSFSEVSCCLIDTLPHQSSAVVSFKFLPLFAKKKEVVFPTFLTSPEFRALLLPESSAEHLPPRPMIHLVHTDSAYLSSDFKRSRVA